MGQSNVTKERPCKHCGGLFYTTATKLKDHASTCKRLSALGLINPTIVVK